MLCCHSNLYPVAININLTLNVNFVYFPSKMSTVKSFFCIEEQRQREEEERLLREEEERKEREEKARLKAIEDARFTEETESLSSLISFHSQELEKWSDKQKEDLQVRQASVLASYCFCRHVVVVCVSQPNPMPT